MIYLIIIGVILILILDFLLDGYKNNLKNQSNNTFVLNEDIAKQLIDRSYNNFNHYSTLYLAHIALFITLFTIMIGFYSYDFNINTIQYNVSKENADLDIIVPLDNISNTSQDINNEQIQEGEHNFKFIISIFFMIILVFSYLSMIHSFIMLTNNREFIKLLEYKLNLPYSQIVERGYYILTWKHIAVYDSINKIILIFILIILLLAFVPLCESIIEKIIMTIMLLKLFGSLIDITQKYKQK